MYDEQILTAVHLVRGAIVQMDTGEGKTFAISTAALALLRLHSKVYVVTANTYLAARDYTQTMPFWDQLGISSGLGLSSTYREYEPLAWEAQVVYTTLEALTFRSLSEDIAEGHVEQTLEWSAVLLDEADAVLLDQSYRPCSSVRLTQPTAKDWTQALRIAEALDVQHVVQGRSLEPSATLTSEGERRVAALAGGSAETPRDLLLLFHDVELAYAALRVAREGHDYEIDSGQAVTMDSASGWRTPGVFYPWVSPLEQHLGLERRPHQVTRHMTDGLTVLRRFAHRGGTSGTVIGEALEYAFLLELPPVRVLPRTPRYDGQLIDQLAISKAMAYEEVARQVHQQGRSRPILIATDSTMDVHELVERLGEPEGISIRGVTGENIAEEALFERAGEPGVTVVSTRVAGRGVDIRLSPEARKNGGAMLLAIGHARQPRLDRQLLGRVGRCGDPYHARFINHPDDPLMQLVLTEAFKIVRRLYAGMPPNSPPMEAKVLDRVIRRAHRGVRRYDLMRFAAAFSSHMAERTAYDMLSTWRRMLGPETREALPEAFIAFLVERYVAAKLPALGFKSRRAEVDPRRTAAEVTDVAGRPEDTPGLVVNLTGQPAEAVRDELLDYLKRALRGTVDRNVQERKRLVEVSLARSRAVAEARLVGFASSLVTASANDGESALAIAAQQAVACSDTFGRLNEGALAAHGRAVLDRAFEDDSDGLVPEIEDPTADDALERLLQAAMSVFSGGADAHQPDAVGRLLKEAAAARRATAEGLEERSLLLSERTSWRIASETMDRATQMLETGLARTRFVLANTVSPARYELAYSSRVDDLKREIEGMLAADLCTNLVAGVDPAALDVLFMLREQTVGTEIPLLELSLPELPEPSVQRYAPVAPTTSSDELSLINDYGRALDERLGDDAPPKELLYPALKALLKHSPLSSLTDPDRVADAYDLGWKRSDVRSRLRPWRRWAVDRSVKGFLTFLHERGVAAPQPSGLAETSQSLARRAKENLAARSKLLGLPLLGIGAVIAAVLWALPGERPLDLPTGLDFLDRVLTAGTLSSGSLLGPVCLALVGAAWVRWLYGLPTTADAGVLGLEQPAGTLFLVVGAIALLRPLADGFSGHIVIALFGCILVVATGVLIRNSASFFEQTEHCHLSAGLAALFAAAAGLPFLVRLSDGKLPLLIGGLCAVILVATAEFRQAQIPAVAVQVDESNLGPGETLNVLLKAQGRLSIISHAFALFFAWLVSCVVLDGGRDARSIAAAIAYLATLSVWTRGLARSATDAKKWGTDMRERDQAYVPGPGRETLAEALLQARRRLVVRELATAAVFVAIGTAAAVEMPPHALSSLPIGMAAVFLTVVTIDLGGAFLRSLKTMLAGGVSVVVSDVSTDESNGVAARAREVVRYYGKRMAIVGVVVGILGKLNSAYNSVHLIESAYHWLIGLF